MESNNGAFAPNDLWHVGDTVIRDRCPSVTVKKCTPFVRRMVNWRNTHERPADQWICYNVKSRHGVNLDDLARAVHPDRVYVGNGWHLIERKDAWRLVAAFDAMGEIRALTFMQTEDVSDGAA